MGIVKFDGNKLIPAPVFSVNRDFQTLGDGTIIGNLYQVVVTGTLLAYMGSPNSSGVFHTAAGYPANESIAMDDRLTALLNKQNALKELFSADNIGKKFEIIGSEGGDPVYFYPKTIQLDLPQGLLHTDMSYSVTMTTDAIYPNVDTVFDDNIESAQESWSIEPDQQNLDNTFNFKVNHSISAKGKRFYNASGYVSQAWAEAKSWVESRAGINYSIISSGLYNLNGLSGYNHLVSTNIDTTDGGYSLSESWIFASGIAYEDFSVSTATGLEGITTVSIEGSINGFENRTLQTVHSSRWSNASGYFVSIQNSLLNRAQEYSGTTLNPVPVSQTVGRNPVGGTISYSYEYNTRPSTYISGAKSEVFVVTYNDRSAAHARVPVIGRTRGPVLQGLGTSDATTKNLSIEFVLGPQFNSANISGSFDFPYNLISGLVDALNPINLGASKSYSSQPQKTWEPLSGRGSFNIEWTYE